MREKREGGKEGDRGRERERRLSTFSCTSEKREKRENWTKKDALEPIYILLPRLHHHVGGLPRASSGQAWNQSMVQQLMRDGNWRTRLRNASPMGLKARIT